MSKITSFAGLVVTFVIAFGCDRWVESLRSRLAEFDNILSFFLQVGIVNLLLVIPLVLLTWFVLFWAKRSNLVSAIFLLVGIVITFAPVLEISIAGFLPPLGIIEFLTPNTRMLYVAAFVSILGLAGFFLPTRVAYKNKTKPATS